MARESWLRSPSHEKFAEAMLRCEHAGAFCAADGYCHYGYCFKPIRERPDALEARLAKIEAVLEELRKGKKL